METQIFSFRSWGTLLVKVHSDSKSKYTEEDITRMLEFLVDDNIFVVFAGKFFQQIIGIPVGTNCAPLQANLFLYSYEAEFIRPCSRPVRNGRYLSSSSHKDTSMTYCPLITKTSIIISVRCIPLSLKSKTRQRATLLLLTWMYSCKLVVTVNFTLSFTTSVAVLISILHTRVVPKVRRHPLFSSYFKYLHVMLYINRKMNHCWLHWYKNSYNSLNV